MEFPFSAWFGNATLAKQLKSTTTIAFSVLLFILVAVVLLRIHRYFYPLQPHTLHKIAILLLEQCCYTPLPISSDGKLRTKRQNRRDAVLVQKAVHLLRKASQLQKFRPSSTIPTAPVPATACSTRNDHEKSPVGATVDAVNGNYYYAPAILSLAALYVYLLEDGASAVELLESTLLSAGKQKNVVPVARTDWQDAHNIWLDAMATMKGRGHTITREWRQETFLTRSFCESLSDSSTAAGASQGAVAVDPVDKKTH